MFFKEDKHPEWLDGTIADACKACLRLFLSHLVRFCGVVVILLFLASEILNSDYDWTASIIFTEVVTFAALFALFEVFVRRYYHKLGDGPVAKGTNAVLADRAKKEKADG